jgi:hypothetical protein
MAVAVYLHHLVLIGIQYCFYDKPFFGYEFLELGLGDTYIYGGRSGVWM